MRAYAWTQLLLGAGHRALQASHAICRVRGKYREVPHMAQIWDTWEEVHRTMVYLNGGFCGDLEEVCITLEALGVGDWSSEDTKDFMFPIPWASFNEDKYTLNGALTSVAAIVHPRYYTPGALARRNRDFKIDNLVKNESTDTDMLVEQNHLEPNEFDHKSRICFVDYRPKEIEFIKFLNDFGLANLG